MLHFLLNSICHIVAGVILFLFVSQSATALDNGLVSALLGRVYYRTIFRDQHSERNPREMRQIEAKSVASDRFD